MPAMEADFVPHAEPIDVDYALGESIPVELHDGSRVVRAERWGELRSHGCGRGLQFHRRQAETKTNT